MIQKYPCCFLVIHINYLNVIHINYLNVIVIAIKYSILLLEKSLGMRRAETQVLSSITEP